MFKQVKSAIFWTLVYKFRKRLTIVAILLSIVLLSQWIYTDLIEYLKLTEKIQYLNYLLPIKWLIIFFNIGLSAYLILTMFKQDKVTSEVKKEKPLDTKKQDNQVIETKEKFTDREKEFLNKKLRSEADILLER